MRTYRVRGVDDGVHVVDVHSGAAPDPLVDPSPYRTRCGQRVLEVYNDRPEVTCSVCAHDDR